MKIAVASENEQVTQHFGHCANYNLYEVENNEITKSHKVPNPGHEPGFLPRFLGDMKVTTMISGGMGKKAVDIFNAQGIEVVIGASGESKQAAQDFLDGKLESTGTPCTDNDHDEDHDCDK